VPLFKENTKRERYLSEQELKALCEAISQSQNSMLEPIISMLILTGARKREVLDARREDFDLARKSWRISNSKSGKARTIPLSEAALGILNRLPKIKGCPYVFANPTTKKPFVCIFNGWEGARKRAGLEDLHVHDLRHSFASFLINAGRSIYEVATLLGHSQIKTTMRYAHLADETLAEAVNTVPLGKVA